MLLELQDVSVRYGAIGAVHDLDLNVDEGEIVTLLGVNGAGKSSTLNAIVGLVPIVGGRCLFEGRDITGASTETIVKAGITMVPEGRRVFRNLSVAENLRLGAASRDRASFDGHFEELSELFPIIRERHDTLAGLLSGGEQQQVAIARALFSRPKLLLLDEPSLGLAPAIVATVFETIEALNRGGVTILLVEQNVERALSIADRCYVLASGRIDMSGRSGDMSSRDIENAYLGIGGAP